MTFSILSSSRARLLELVAALTLFSVAGCEGKAPEQTHKPVRPAKLIEITASSGVRTVSLPAIIEATDSAELSFQVGGRLKELPVRAGQKIKRGAVIARLDQRNFQNELATAEAQFRIAESEFRRVERLLEQDVISRSEYEQRKSKRDIARAALDTARKHLDDATLRSPFSGIVAKVHTEQFQNVPPQQRVVTLQTTGAAAAAIQVPARLVANSGRIEVEETVVVLDAASGIRIPAEFRSMDTQADPKTQTFLLKFAFTPPDDLRILPGMTGTVHSRVRTPLAGGSSDRITVPFSAILSDGDAHYVWVVDKSAMTVSRRDIVVALGVGESLVVLEGLQAGEIIVGAGASYLHEGMRIRPFEG